MIAKELKFRSRWQYFLKTSYDKYFLAPFDSAQWILLALNLKLMTVSLGCH